MSGKGIHRNCIDTKTKVELFLAFMSPAKYAMLELATANLLNHEAKTTVFTIVSKALFRR